MFIVSFTFNLDENLMDVLINKLHIHLPNLSYDKFKD